MTPEARIWFWPVYERDGPQLVALFKSRKLARDFARKFGFRSKENWICVNH